MSDPSVVREIVLLTPDLASALLAEDDKERPVVDGHARNRTVNEAHVSKLADAMRSGRWIDDAADPIRLAADGAMLDGRHRCRAVVRSGVPIGAEIVRGLPRRAFAVLGQQRVRTAGDIVHAAGMNNAHSIAAMVTMAWLVDRGGSELRRPSHQQVAEVIAAHPELHEARKSVRGEAHKLWNRSLAGYLLWVTDGLAQDFVDGSAEAVGLVIDDPRLAMHRLLNEQKTGRSKVTGRDMLPIALKAYDAFARDKPLRLLRWLGRRAERWPTLRHDIAPRAGLTLRHDLPEQQRLPLKVA